MSFSRAPTPRNPSFYRSESPGFKYRPQTADSQIFPASRSARIFPSLGRSQSFILVGKASCSDKSYDCRGTAAHRVLETKSSRSSVGPGEYRPNQENVVSRYQHKRYLKNRDPRNIETKGVHKAGRYTPFTKQKSTTVPRFVNKRKKTWFPVGDAKLVAHPGPGTYDIRKGRGESSRVHCMTLGHALRNVSESKPVKEPLVVIAQTKRIQHRRTKNDPYKSKSPAEWRISRSKSYDKHAWPNTFRS